MSNRTHQRGVTLIELLIAVTLVGALSLAGLIALRVGLNAMQKTNSHFMANRRVIGAERALERQVAGFMPVLAECVTGADAPQARIPFFEGEPNAMRFVSSYSLEESFRGMPRILEYNVIQGENGEGVRLVVTEYLYTGPRSTGAFCLGPEQWLPIESGPRAFVLADKLAACRMLYRESIPEPPYERWTPRWTGRFWPTAVRIEITALNPDPTRLPLTTLTMPLRAQKIPEFPYAP